MFVVGFCRKLREFVFVFAGVKSGGNAARQFRSVVCCGSRGLNSVGADGDCIFCVWLELLVWEEIG